MKIMVVPIVVVTLGTLRKFLENELKELKIEVRIKTIQDTEKSLINGETCCHSDSNEKPPADAGGKNSQEL